MCLVVLKSIYHEPYFSKTKKGRIKFALFTHKSKFYFFAAANFLATASQEITLKKALM